MWLITLSRQLPVIALVGRYPTNKLIGREPIRRRQHRRGRLSRRASTPGAVRGIVPGFPGVSPTFGQVAHVLLTRSPLYWVPEGTVLARLACVRHAASVRPEPGSNSPYENLVECARPKPVRTPDLVERRSPVESEDRPGSRSEITLVSHRATRSDARGSRSGPQVTHTFLSKSIAEGHTPSREDPKPTQQRTDCQRRSRRPERRGERRDSNPRPPGPQPGALTT